MSRTVKPLTDTQIKNAKPKLKEYNLPDGDGLFLRVKANGRKNWIYNYRRPQECVVIGTSRPFITPNMLCIMLLTRK